MRNMLMFSFVIAVFFGLAQNSSSQLIPDNVDQRIRGSVIPVNTSAYPIEVEVLLLRFDNPHGIIYSGKRCDFFVWGCDINAFGYIDIVKPYDEWPGQREVSGSDHFWYKGEDSSPIFNKVFKMTVCNPDSFKAGNLRVHLMDVDGGLRGSDDFINNFNCIFTKGSVIASGEQSAPWSAETACDALYSNPLMGMFFKYRLYRSSSPNPRSCPSPK